MRLSVNAHVASPTPATFVASISDSLAIELTTEDIVSALFFNASGSPTLIRSRLLMIPGSELLMELTMLVIVLPKAVIAAGSTVSVSLNHPSVFVFKASIGPVRAPIKPAMESIRLPTTSTFCRSSRVKSLVSLKIVTIVDLMLVNRFTNILSSTPNIFAMSAPDDTRPARPAISAKTCANPVSAIISCDTAPIFIFSSLASTPFVASIIFPTIPGTIETIVVITLDIRRRPAPISSRPYPEAAIAPRAKAPKITGIIPSIAKTIVPITRAPLAIPSLVTIPPAVSNAFAKRRTPPAVKSAIPPKITPALSMSL